MNNNDNDIDYLKSKLKELEDRLNNLVLVPTFKFALREDLKNDKRFLPTKAEPESTGYDVRAAQNDRKPLIIKPGQYVKIPLGFRCYVPRGWWYQLHPRSSSFIKKHMHNLIGIIDESWEGETQFVGQYIPCSTNYDGYVNNVKSLFINFGDPIGQIIPIKKESMTVLEITNNEIDNLYKERNFCRKTGGFGSTS
jgi:dUTPase